LLALYCAERRQKVGDVRLRTEEKCGVIDVASCRPMWEMNGIVG
jgi:hypothetical protein